MCSLYCNGVHSHQIPIQSLQHLHDTTVSLTWYLLMPMCTLVCMLPAAHTGSSSLSIWLLSNTLLGGAEQHGNIWTCNHQQLHVFTVTLQAGKSLYKWRELYNKNIHLSSTPSGICGAVNFRKATEKLVGNLSRPIFHCIIPVTNPTVSRSIFFYAEHVCFPGSELRLLLQDHFVYQA